MKRRGRHYADRPSQRIPCSLDPKRHRSGQWRVDWTEKDLERLSPEALTWLEQFSEEYYQGWQRKGREPILSRAQLRDAWRAQAACKRDITGVSRENFSAEFGKKTRSNYEPREYDFWRIPREDEGDTERLALAHGTLSPRESNEPEE